VELEPNGVADLDLGGVAEDDAVGVGGDGVPTFEDFHGAALFELQGEASQAVALGAENPLGADAKIGSAFLKAQTERGNLHPKIKRSDAEMGSRETLATVLEPRAETEGEARSHLIGALAMLAEKVERATETAAS
jgi:hypothetical protein